MRVQDNQERITSRLEFSTASRGRVRRRQMSTEQVRR